MTMVRTARLKLLLLSLALSGCATVAPPIQTAKVQRAKTVVIEGVPYMPLTAHVTQQVAVLRDQYFTPQLDWHFAPNHGRVPAPVDNAGAQAAVQQISQPTSPAAGSAAGAAGAALGGALADGLNASSNEAAADFEKTALSAQPDLDLRRAFYQALTTELQARGVQASIDHATESLLPRRRWPAVGTDGKALPTRDGNAPPVDADLLVQVYPVAFYWAPGVMTSYRRQVAAAVAVYDGRTKEFLGEQFFVFKAPDSKFEYMRYAAMKEEAGVAAAALQEALVSLAPQVADAVTGKAAAR